MSSKPSIDLRMDLAKIRAALNSGELQMSDTCSYTAPCAIGVLFTPEQCEVLSQSAEQGIEEIIRDGDVTAPADQVYDIAQLQVAFDTNSHHHRFLDILTHLEAQYAAI